MRQVLLNIVIAFLWVLFQDEDSLNYPPSLQVISLVY